MDQTEFRKKIQTMLTNQGELDTDGLIYLQTPSAVVHVTTEPNKENNNLVDVTALIVSMDGQRGLIDGCNICVQSQSYTRTARFMNNGKAHIDALPRGMYKVSLEC